MGSSVAMGTDEANKLFVCCITLFVLLLQGCVACATSLS